MCGNLIGISPELPAPLRTNGCNSSTSAVPPFPSLAAFIQEITNGNANDLVGLYAPYTLAYKIVSQPQGEANWIDEREGVVTQFSLARDTGSIGLLAHYEHAGSSFYHLIPGQSVYLIYGDGKAVRYQITEIDTYKAEEPQEPTTSFITAADGRLVAQSDVFNQIYNSPGRLILQTCLVSENSHTWGRMFVIAEPVDPHFESELLANGFSLPEGWQPDSSVPQSHQ